jgi:CHASE2 domain-containing sensor protein
LGRRRPGLSPKWKKRLGDYKEDLLKAVLLTVPLALLAKLNEQVSARILSQPWQAIWLLVPIAIVAALLRQRAIRQHALHPDRRMLLFLGAYLLLFTVASQSGVLDVSRELSAFGAPASRRWLTPVSWGDWRYRLLSRKPERDQLVVVLLRSGADRSAIDGRKEIIDLIALASQQQARGVALDVYFNEPSAIDPLLCQVVTNAAKAMPVFVGYGFEIQDGRVVELGVPPTLGACLPQERLAHLAGFLDFDLVSRLTPLFFRGDTTRPALGLAVARALAAKPSLPSSPSGSTDQASIDLPDDGLVRFIAPADGGPLTVRFDELQSKTKDANLLRGRFVMAGQAEQDSFETAFGRQPGIVVHAYVAHSLIESHYIQRQSWWLGFAITLVFCYWLTIACAHGASAGALVSLCLGATAVVVGVSAASIIVGPYWFDVVYPLVTIWLLLPLLAATRWAIPTRKRGGE